MKREAPAAARNRQPILDVLRTCLPATGLVLEVASGTGEHAVHFAQALPALVFQPTDPGAEQRASIDDWTQTLGLPNWRSPMRSLEVQQFKSAHRHLGMALGVVALFF